MSQGFDVMDPVDDVGDFSGALRGYPVDGIHLDVDVGNFINKISHVVTVKFFKFDDSDKSPVKPAVPHQLLVGHLLAHKDDGAVADIVDVADGLQDLGLFRKAVHLIQDDCPGLSFLEIDDLIEDGRDSFFGRGTELLDNIP